MSPEQILPIDKTKECLPALEVKNKVVWTNPDFSLPFEMTIGKPCKLGLFLTPKKTKESQPLEILPTHGRSTILLRQEFSDEQGNLYREIELKGTGYVKPDYLYPDDRDKTTVGKIKPRINRASPEPGAMGILNLKFAEKDRKYSELFYKNKIRVPRAIALIELLEIIDEDGQKISVDEAKKKGLIPQNIVVGVEVRSFCTRARISEGFLDNWELLINDAKQLVAKELGIDPEKFNLPDYLKWFAKTLAEQIAKIQKLGYHHGYLTPQNITLDCRIVDFDSVQPFTELTEEKRAPMEKNIITMAGIHQKNLDLQTLAKAYDYIRTFSSFDKLLQYLGLQAGKDTPFLRELSSIFHKSYLESGGEELPF